MTMSLRRITTMKKVAKMKTWNKMITTMKKLMMRMIKSKSKSTLVAILIIWTD
jgi:translation initiation factor 2 alpha subunit (eIF-2alpha)